MLLVLIIIGMLLMGFVSIKVKRKKTIRKIIWLLPLAYVLAAYILIHDDRPWYRMTLYIFVLFLGMKTVTAVYRYSDSGRLNLLQWCCFTLGWPGMDPIPFEQLGKVNLKFRNSHLTSGFLSIICGSLLLFGDSLLLNHTNISPYILCLLSFVPFVLILHMGIFNIMATIWSWFGVMVSPLMDAPWKSDSISSFWGRRWNIAFIQMTRISIFIPLARKNRPKLALFFAFLISGIFHEVALSLPVSAGFGLPSLFFLLQFVLILIEKKLITDWPKGMKRLWVLAMLLLPFPLLFHPAFLQQVFLPFLESLT